MLNLQKKQNIVFQINQNIKNAESVIIANFTGTTVNEINELRKLAHKDNIYIHVIRNTLIKLSIKKTQHECLNNNIIGPNLIAYSQKHPGIAARLLKNFMEDHPNFKIKAASFNGKLITFEQIEQLVNIPTFEEGIAQIMFVMQEISFGKLIRILYNLSNRK
uniref:Large ribosomal subunit protein uL10 n=1 Tax=Candidatus Aschnera chinzeii TaxID=1485666 RepID=A0AAT9G3X3_9ENTR|nr:MAG: 50S ribosomal protein L10 [Candidatus Aschnera chinzeii]